MNKMYRKIFAVALVFAMAATALFAASQQEEKPAAAAEKNYVTDPTTGEMVVAPEYGGTLNYASYLLWENCDPTTRGIKSAHLIGVVNEQISIADWGMSRDVFDHRPDYIPTSAFKGHLAESWDVSPDGFTFTFHIREGVHWHNKAPMNGRELTADDIVYNYQRFLGQGEFKRPKKCSLICGLSIDSITATDRYTMVIK